MNNLILRKLQLTELEILKQIDAFCLNYGIQYSLYAGTALGAVRHGGFIPWDDDIDIVMTRDNYIRFCKKWKEHPIKGLYLQNIETDEKCDINHAKIRMDNTIFLSEGEDEHDGHHGIWIDIFSWDKIPENSILRIPLYLNLYELFLITKANKSYENDRIIKKILAEVIKIIPFTVRRKEQFRILRLLNKNTERTGKYLWTSTSRFVGLKFIIPKDIPQAYTRILFEGCEVSIFKDYDRYLKLDFGDYMKLPPVEQRVCKHNPKTLKLLSDDSDNGTVK